MFEYKNPRKFFNNHKVPNGYYWLYSIGNVLRTDGTWGHSDLWYLMKPYIEGRRESVGYIHKSKLNNDKLYSIVDLNNHDKTIFKDEEKFLNVVKYLEEKYCENT